MAMGQGFGPKLQAGGFAAFELGIPLAPWLELAPSLSLFSVLPSDAQGGFLYRGYEGAALIVMLRARGVVASSATIGELGMGGGVGGAAALPSYQYTTLYFFYPEARLEAFLDFRPAGQPIDLVFSVPARVQFRRDMDYSVSAGAGVSVRYLLKAGK
jgi:hypothetical protein